MSNTCDTIIHFRGDDALIADLFSKLHAGMTHKELADLFDVSSEDDFRANITDIESAENTIYQSDAWMPHVSLWDAIIEKHYKNNISYVYRAEEPSDNIYINTDTTGITFPEKYVIDYNINGKCDVMYFSSDDELINWCNTELGFNQTSVSGIQNEANAMLDEPDREDDRFTLGIFTKE